MPTVLSKVTYPLGVKTLVPFPTPATIKWELNTEDAPTSGRNASGYMFRDVVADKRKLQVSWPPLDDTQISTLLQMIDAPFFEIEYPDAHDGTVRDMECYVGNRPAPIKSYNATSGKWLWGSLSVSFIER